MTREEGIKEIDAAEWQMDDANCLNLRVHDEHGRLVHAWLQRRPHYCDRGHIHLLMEIPGPHPGLTALDDADAFPRYFFSFTEADTHTRTFLKWRLWGYRVNPGYVLDEVWHNFKARSQQSEGHSGQDNDHVVSG